jgi:hypothetical protein
MTDRPEGRGSILIRLQALLIAQILLPTEIARQLILNQDGPFLFWHDHASSRGPPGLFPFRIYLPTTKTIGPRIDRMMQEIT